MRLAKEIDIDSKKLFSRGSSNIVSTAGCCARLLHCTNMFGKEAVVTVSRYIFRVFLPRARVLFLALAPKWRRSQDREDCPDGILCCANCRSQVLNRYIDLHELVTAFVQLFLHAILVLQNHSLSLATHTKVARRSAHQSQVQCVLDGVNACVSRRTPLPGLRLGSRRGCGIDSEVPLERRAVSRLLSRVHVRGRLVAAECPQRRGAC